MIKHRINFSIPNTNFNLVAYDPSIFIKRIPKKEGRQIFKEWYIEYKDGVTQSFIEDNVIEDLTHWIKDKIITDPNWADKMHKGAEEYNHEYFLFARNIVEKINLKEISNKKLFELYRDLRKHQACTHSYAIATTWFVDSDGEVYSKYLQDKLNQHLEKQNINDKTSQVEYFTILTTPHRQGFAGEEQIEFLELIEKIQNSKKSVDNFCEEIKEHYDKWHWVPYGYIGPAYTLNYYEKKVVEEMKTEDIKELLQVEKNREENNKKERKNLTEKIKLPDDLRHLFDIARDIIWLKDYRKYCLWHGHYVLDILTKEIARRVHISHKQANHMLTKEVEDALLHNKVNTDLLNQRIEHTLIYSTEAGYKFYYGEEAEKIRRSFYIEEVKIDLSQGFKGTCACPGEVKGVVKIVNSVEDIDKVNPGDIMLALTTYPSMLPAMKKAGAIISEDGGITCHAAIVSREFRIPCVVGVKKITKVFKDGDKVRVDATEGVIKKID